MEPEPPHPQAEVTGGMAYGYALLLGRSRCALLSRLSVSLRRSANHLRTGTRRTGQRGAAPRAPYLYAHIFWYLPYCYCLRTLQASYATVHSSLSRVETKVDQYLSLSAPSELPDTPEQAKYSVYESYYRFIGASGGGTAGEDATADSAALGH